MYYRESNISFLELAFNYLGKTLYFNGSFDETQSVLASQSRRAMHVLFIVQNEAIAFERENKIVIV